MNPRDVKITPITWTSSGGTDYSQPIMVADFRDIDITVVGTGTVTVRGSADKEIVDFTAASTIINSHVPVVIADLGTANTYATSLAVAGATKIGEVNTNLLCWICLTRSANTVDAFITTCDNA